VSVGGKAPPVRGLASFSAACVARKPLGGRCGKRRNGLPRRGGGNAHVETGRKVELSQKTKRLSFQRSRLNGEVSWWKV